MLFKQKLKSQEETLPLVMAILNVTPDSFSDGGVFTSIDKVKIQLEKMAKAGVSIVDIGGESTRPGAVPVPLPEELDRVLPVIELAKKEFSLPVSVDTYKTEVMAEGIKLGVELVNDTNALQADGARKLIAEHKVLACLMHKKGQPKTMQDAPEYKDVVEEVKDFLLKNIAKCIEDGIAKDNLIIDPGFGFGKDIQHNISLFKAINNLVSLGFPVLVGVSRKRMIADILGGIDERMIGSVSAALIAGLQGAKIVRVHDFAETIQAIKIMKELV